MSGVIGFNLTPQTIPEDSEPPPMPEDSDPPPIPSIPPGGFMDIDEMVADILKKTELELKNSTHSGIYILDKILFDDSKERIKELKQLITNLFNEYTNLTSQNGTRGGGWSIRKSAKKKARRLKKKQRESQRGIREAREKAEAEKKIKEQLKLKIEELERELKILNILSTKEIIFMKDREDLSIILYLPVTFIPTEKDRTELGSYGEDIIGELGQFMTVPFDPPDLESTIKSRAIAVRKKMKESPPDDRRLKYLKRQRMESEWFDELKNVIFALVDELDTIHDKDKYNEFFNDKPYFRWETDSEKNARELSQDLRKTLPGNFVGVMEETGGSERDKAQGGGKKKRITKKITKKINRGKAINPKLSRNKKYTKKQYKRHQSFKKKKGYSLKMTKKSGHNKNSKSQRPSASYYYNILRKPVGTKVNYGTGIGKNNNYVLRLRKNGSPFWKKLR